MYFDGEFLEKKMSPNLLDLPRVETRDIDHVERARRLAPMLKEAADEIEARRELPERVVEALIEGGYFKLLIPRSLGGAELHPLTYVQVLEEIAKAEPSTAWCLGQNSGCSMSAPYLDPAVSREVFGPPAGASRSMAASGSPGGGGLRPAAVTPPGSARMSRCSRRTARRG
jgi:indole-3-acetate monooxygenase